MAGVDPADMKLLEHFCDPEWLASVSPVAKATFESTKEIRDAYRHISYAGKYTKIGGFDKDGFQQHVARLTPEQWQAINMIDPEILTVRHKFYAWLERHKDACDVRGKVMLYS